VNLGLTRNRQETRRSIRIIQLKKYPFNTRMHHFNQLSWHSSPYLIPPIPYLPGFPKVLLSEHYRSIGNPHARHQQRAIQYLFSQC
jgi:hypothetical protein